MRKPETEYDEMMRRSKKIISQLLSAIITLNLGTEYYNRGKESNNVLVMPYYMSFFTDKGGLNQKLNEEEIYIWEGKTLNIVASSITSTYYTNKT